MITLKQWLETINYRITEGSDYYLHGTSAGSVAYCLDTCDDEEDGVSSSFCFNPKDQTPIFVEVFDYAKNRAYKLINAEYYAKFNIPQDKIAWDDVEFTYLEVDDDMLEKLTAIMSYQPYDDRIQVPINLPDDVMFTLMKEAHKQDITFNEYVMQMLSKLINEQQS